MQFLINVIDDTNRPTTATDDADEAGTATSDEMEAIDGFNERLQEAGQWVFAGGIASPSSSIVIDNRRGAGLVTDGPFVEAKEYVAGFWIIDVASAEVARDLAIEGSRCCNRKVELRPFLR